MSAGDIIAICTLSVQIGKACKTYLSEIRHRNESVQQLSQRLQALANVAERLKDLQAQHPDKLPVTSEAVGSLQTCRNDLELIQKALEPFRAKLNQSATIAAKLKLLKWPMANDQIKAEIIRLDAYIQSFGLAISVDSGNATIRIESRVEGVGQTLEKFESRFDTHEQRALLAALDPVFEAAFNSIQRQHEPQCLSGTRIDVIHGIKAWSLDPASEPIFWLCGMAGTGKSTIAQTLAQQFHDDGRLGGSYFLSRSQNFSGLTKLDRLFATLAYQMSIQNQDFQEHICHSVERDIAIAKKRLEDQYRVLFTEPLRSIASSGTHTKPFVFIIDALDECHDPRDVEALLALISATTDLGVLGAKLILTSRPDQIANVGFMPMVGRSAWSVRLHDLDKTLVREDIKKFLVHQFAALANRHGLEKDWVGTDKVEELSVMSESLFIYPATICRYLDAMKGKRQMKTFVSQISSQNKVSSTSLHHIDLMYSMILEGLCSDDEYMLDFKSVVGSVLHLGEALTTQALGQLLYLSEQDADEIIDDALSPLSSVINYSEQVPITLLHTSFRDFLLDRERCTISSYWIDSALANTRLAQACLDLMSLMLRKDICGIMVPGQLIDETDRALIAGRLPSHLAYACRYWLQHVCASFDSFDQSTVIRFLDHHALHWIEALAWLGEVPQGANQITDLYDLIDTTLKNSAWQDGNSKCLSETYLAVRVYDIKKFMLAFGKVISVAPLQTYCSALAFAPSESFLRRTFGADIPRWLHPLPKTTPTWSPRLAVLQSTINDPDEIKFSPDSKLLVSFSANKILDVWDTRSCLLRYSISIGSESPKKNWTRCSSLLPRTKLLFAASGALLMLTTPDSIMHVCDLRSGIVINTCQAETLVAGDAIFSSDEAAIVILHQNNRLMTWNFRTGYKSAQDAFISYKGELEIVAVAHDLRHILLHIRLPDQNQKTSAQSSLVTNVAMHTPSLSPGDFLVYDTGKQRILSALRDAPDFLDKFYLSEIDNTIIATCQNMPTIPAGVSGEYMSTWIWDLSQGALKDRLTDVSLFRGSQVSANCRFIAFAWSENEYLYSTTTQKRELIPTTLEAVVDLNWLRPDEPARLRKFSKDVRSLVLYNCRAIEIWDVKHHVLLNKILAHSSEPTNFVPTIHVSPDTSLIATGLRQPSIFFRSGITNDQLTLWETRRDISKDNSANQITNDEEDSTTVSAMLSGASSVLVVCSKRGVPILFDAATAFEYSILDLMPPLNHKQMLISRDGSILAYYQDLESSEAPHQGVERAAEVSQCSRTPETTSAEGLSMHRMVGLIDTTNGKVINSFKLIAKGSIQLHFSETNVLAIVVQLPTYHSTQLATSTIYLWHRQSPEFLQHIQLPDNELKIKYVFFSPRSTRLAVRCELAKAVFESGGKDPDHLFIIDITLGNQGSEVVAHQHWNTHICLPTCFLDEECIITSLPMADKSGGLTLNRNFNSIDCHSRLPLAVIGPDSRHLAVLEDSLADRNPSIEIYDVQSLRRIATIHFTGGTYYSIDPQDRCLILLVQPRMVDMEAPDSSGAVTLGAAALQRLSESGLLRVSTICMDETCSWILSKGRRCVWIPPSSRPGADSGHEEEDSIVPSGRRWIKVQGNTIWILSSEGHLTRFTLDPDHSITV